MSLEVKEYVENNKFVLRNTFGVIKELNFDDCFYTISFFDAGRIRGYMGWICIYTIDEKNYLKELIQMEGNIKEYK